ncbi:TorD/DmsD family molecular chaperone [Natrialbaceae archaeon AArc-T1-2]|uniref:TorD/DmsD family molecular chaperone n=1 Tax=Natrialbaceae archaeon AArc-T1-2 TaxID=3053904 RepID=UPI00255AE325|nr:molecular chaperone TorD family protein [Natrialbaceae archaeon AArc-T1-2]WIV66677.1 molecular chaperone TorD family protein [Natrialbaceae archaeon AArc-T1-2]
MRKTTDTDRTNELADLYGFCSSVIADPPDERATERLVAEEFPREASPQALENGFRLLGTWQSGVDDPADAAEKLRRIHTSLFVGPRPRMQAHESWYADDYLGEPLAAVKRSYRDLGIRPTDQLREEADHAAVELAALETLARDGADEYRRAFLLAHGWWIPQLATDVQELADDPFYEGVGWLIEGVFEADTYLLGIDPADLERGYDVDPSHEMDESVLFGE